MSDRSKPSPLGNVYGHHSMKGLHILQAGVWRPIDIEDLHEWNAEELRFIADLLESSDWDPINLNPDGTVEVSQEVFDLAMKVN